MLNVLMGYNLRGRLPYEARERGQLEDPELGRRRKQIDYVSSSIRLINPAETAIDIVSPAGMPIHYWRKTDDPKEIRPLKRSRKVDCTYLRDQPWVHLSQVNASACSSAAPDGSTHGRAGPR